MTSQWKRSLAVLAVGSALACASGPRPVEQLAESEAALRSAQELGAKQVPQAALEVQLAEEELQHAKDLIKDDDNDKATLQLMRSKADAELAVALTRQTQAQGAAQSAEQQLKSLQGQAQ